MNHSRTLVIDIETNLAHDTIWCAVTNDVDTGEVRVWTEAESLRKYLRQSDRFVGHNIISFDAPILNRLWNTRIRLSQTSDTLVMSRLLQPTLEGGHSLEAWGKRLGKHKGEFNKFDEGLSQEMIEYCIQDTHVTVELYKLLSRELASFGDSTELEHQVAAVIARQERHGFLLDQVKCTMLLSGWKAELSAIEERMQKIFPPIVTERVSEKTGKKLKDKVEYFNPGSRQQIAARLMSLGWKPEKHTEKGQVIVDESVLSGLDIPEAKEIANYLLIQKRVAQVESWLDAVKPDGRVRGKVISNGAVTGRMTHHSPNMAQIPSSSSPYGEDCRSCWTTPEGKMLVGIDASGLELRMLAHYMKDASYVREVCEGDVHTKNQTAAGLPTRPQAKTFIYAFLYGAGPAKIGSIVGGGAEDGRRLIDSFLSNTPALKALRAKVEKLAEKGYLPGLDGRKLQVRSSHAALNTLLQGAGAIVMKKALVLLDESIKSNRINAQFVANVHDEWQIEVDEKDAELVGQLGVDAIKQAGIELDLRCPLTGEYRVGKTWKDTH